MAIDADLGAGMFTDEQARSRCERIAREAEFVAPILMSTRPARFHLRRALEPFLPEWVVQWGRRKSPISLRFDPEECFMQRETTSEASSPMNWTRTRATFVPANTSLSPSVNKADH